MKDLMVCYFSKHCYIWSCHLSMFWENTLLAFDFLHFWQNFEKVFLKRWTNVPAFSKRRYSISCSWCIQSRFLSFKTENRRKFYCTWPKCVQYFFRKIRSKDVTIQCLLWKSWVFDKMYFLWLPFLIVLDKKDFFKANEPNESLIGNFQKHFVPA